MRCKEKIGRDEDIQDEKKMNIPFYFPFKLQRNKVSIDEMLFSFFNFFTNHKKIDVSHIMTSHVKFEDSKKLHLFGWREICYLLNPSLQKDFESQKWRHMTYLSVCLQSTECITNLDMLILYWVWAQATCFLIKQSVPKKILYNKSGKNDPEICLLLLFPMSLSLWYTLYVLPLQFFWLVLETAHERE